MNNYKHKALKAKKPTLEQIQQAKQILNDAKFIGVDSLFSCTDIIGRCKDLGLYPPNLAQQFKIIELINRRFDASIGINWDSIDVAIFEIMEPSIDD